MFVRLTERDYIVEITFGQSIASNQFSFLPSAKTLCEGKRINYSQLAHMSKKKLHRANGSLSWKAFSAVSDEPDCVLCQIFDHFYKDHCWTSAAQFWQLKV